MNNVISVWMTDSFELLLLLGMVGWGEGGREGGRVGMREKKKKNKKKKKKKAGGR